MSYVMGLNTYYNYVTEVPNSLKQLARLVVRGFYTTEDSLIIDMLVRNPCMKEDDIAELLRFEKKQLRARLSTLRNDKFIQLRLKMETGPEGKAQKINYYFINYRTFVNVVKYKLDIMRKRLETEERDATSRASFKCLNCSKTFTDLEADQLFDFTTQEFRCTFCGHLVEEDSAALPEKDSRLMLARFNEQMSPLYDLLMEVEGIKLAPEIMEPEPIDINTIRGIAKPVSMNCDGQQWSGEATRNQGFTVEDTRVDITIGDEDATDNSSVRKTRPIWMTESTVINKCPENVDDMLTEVAQNALQSQCNTATSATTSSSRKKEQEDIMSVLLQHEKHPDEENYIKAIQLGNECNISDAEEGNKRDNIRNPNEEGDFDNYINSESDDDEEEDEVEAAVPVVLVAGHPFPIHHLTDVLIAKMTPQEKECYIHVYQEHYSHIYD